MVKYNPRQSKYEKEDRNKYRMAAEDNEEASIYERQNGNSQEELEALKEAADCYNKARDHKSEKRVRLRIKNLEDKINNDKEIKPITLIIISTILILGSFYLSKHNLTGFAISNSEKSFSIIGTIIIIIGIFTAGYYLRNK